MHLHNSQQLRMSGICIIFFLCYSAIIANLFFLQLYQHTFFADLADKQYQLQVTHTPERALIVDRNNRPVALNKIALSAFVSPKQASDQQSLSLFLQQYFPHAYARYQQHKDRIFMFIQRNITDEQKDLIAYAQIPDIQFVKEPHRYYPYKSMASIIGITNIDNVGSLGIEYQFNEQLKGTSSSYDLQKDARGYFYFNRTVVSSGIEGTPVQLTIDSDLQFLVSELLKETVDRFQAKQGSVIVLDPQTGDILVMVNYPTFDPNDLQHLDLALTKNYCIAEQYEIGSVMKVFTALAALEDDVVTIDETIDCRNAKTTHIDGRRVNTTVAHGILTFSEVIEKSNNIGIALVAKRLGEQLYHHYRQAGFGTKTGIALPGEQKGFINPPSCWSKQSVISLSYGYEITITLLQLAQAFTLLANNGCMVKPRIILDNTQPEFCEPEFCEHKFYEHKFSEPLYSQSAIDDLNTILERTTLQGTARRARMQGYEVMCKTGTANLLKDGVYIDTKNSYSCAGIIKKGNYKRVIVNFIKEASRSGLYASQVAVPLFEKVAQKTIIHDRVI